jgi:hypothetical protein
VGKNRLVVKKKKEKVYWRERGVERKHTIKKNTEALLAASKEIGLHVNTQNSKCILCFMKRVQDTIITMI